MDLGEEALVAGNEMSCEVGIYDHETKALVVGISASRRWSGAINGADLSAVRSRPGVAVFMQWQKWATRHEPLCAGRT